MSKLDRSEIDIQRIISDYYSYVGVFDVYQLSNYLVDFILDRLVSDFNTISLIGGAGSGKSYLVQKIKNILPDADSICTDDFLIGTRDYRQKHMSGWEPLRKYNFDLLRNTVQEIKVHSREKSIWVPVYNEFYGSGIKIETEGEIKEVDTYSGRFISSVKYLIIEGDFQPLLLSPDLIFFLYLPDNIRLRNRIKRDLNMRNYQAEDVIAKNFHQRNLSQHIPYTMPWASKANILINTIVDRSNKYSYNLYIRKIDGQVNSTQP